MPADVKVLIEEKDAEIEKKCLNIVRTSRLASALVGEKDIGLEILLNLADGACCYDLELISANKTLQFSQGLAMMQKIYSAQVKRIQEHKTGGIEPEERVYSVTVEQHSMILYFIGKRYEVLDKISVALKELEEKVNQKL